MLQEELQICFCTVVQKHSRDGGRLIYQAVIHNNSHEFCDVRNITELDSCTEFDGEKMVLKYGLVSFQCKLFRAVNYSVDRSIKTVTITKVGNSYSRN